MGKIHTLRSKFDTSHTVWFFVDVKFRILYFNKKAAANCILFHQKELNTGDSILDYARGTENNVDEDFITCLGKTASGQVVEWEQQIIYKEATIWTRTTYIPVYRYKVLNGISIEVEILPA